MQHFVLEDASWELYEKLLRDIGNRPIRVTYDQGRMEIMAPLAEHEGPKRIIGRMIEMLTFELNIPVASYGSTTFRQKEKAKGLEPDECYYFRHEAKMRGRKRIDLRKDPPPDLVVEIDVTSRSVARQPIYAALGVPEIWRYDGRRLQCLHRANSIYQARKLSLAFPFLEPARLQQFIDVLPQLGETLTLHRFVEWVQANDFKPQ
jgi:Uma2 family endonuclease